MSTAEILFFILAGLTVLAAVLTISSKSPIHSILYLIITFFSISAHYVLLNAQFLAVVNIIVYGGAIMVLFLFVVMLMNLNKEDKNFSKSFIIIAGSIASILFFVLTANIFNRAGISNEILTADGEIGLTEKLGEVLYSEYVIPFELASILFMGAMIGAVLLSKKREEEKLETKK
ncbi:MAG: NADH-quinone oxidoreductase subunit J [Weeksellaceae bacterium]|jgi:NADH-quinone oxidoreductase subunit J|nr:NADH-quinone oxidoreductase subunit J [Weeksellaceae bacterium]